MWGMFELRIHGRGGQEAVSASTMLATAAHKAGRHVQAFAIYEAEGRGAHMPQPPLLRSLRT
jgi:Pyruvate/2-oxoacid:ferredoxin oxidoreductase gamma subunit